MDARITQRSMNSAQMFVFQTFAVAKNEQTREELTSLYLDYIQKKMDEESDKWWKENGMSQEKIDELLNSHHRTPYKQ
ncbi:MAG: hypothetical protein LBC84_03495 [Prevotellaceae bacterium]|jgi:hypothetical protein|nr:hypothetical protein [Prevotellaceae bacterium]